MEQYRIDYIKDVVFGKTNERELTLDIIKPIHNGERNFPAIIYVHGGGWMSGDKGGIGGEWNASFAPFGFVCVNINYRLSGEAIFPASLMDVKMAISWVRQHAAELYIDPNKIGIWGHSSGGHLASLAALTANSLEYKSDRLCGYDGVQAVVTLSGPTDLSVMGEWHDYPRSPESKFLGGPVQERRDLAQKANPINYASQNKELPFLIIHGENDPLCPVEQGRNLHKALENSTFLEIKGADHDLVGGNLTMDEILDIIRGFFSRHLVKGTMSREKLFEHREEYKKVVNWFIANSK